MFNRLNCAILAIFVCLAFQPRAEAQYVDQGIQNISQEMQNWCWAAAAQQIIYHRTGLAPAQCQMVAVANQASPVFCCNNPWQCDVPGSMQQIQALIAGYGLRPSSLAFPSDPMTLYNKLNSGVSIIMFVRNSPYQQVGHFVVIRGMDWSRGFPVVFINDPMNWNGFSQPIPYNQLARFWYSAIEVY